MTSPAVIVLAMALVCLSMGAELEKTADYETKHDMHEDEIENKINNTNMTRTKTPIDNNSKIILNKLDEIYTGLDRNVHSDLETYENYRNNNFTRGFLPQKDNKKVNNELVLDFQSKEIQKLDNKRLNNEIIDLISENKVTNDYRKFVNEEITRDFISKSEYNHVTNEFTLSFLPKRRVKRDDDQEAKCEAFMFETKDQAYITHPHGRDSKNNYYYSDMNCVTVISGAAGTVVQLTFIDMFHIEYHPECIYDYLEIRDGPKGYAKLLDKVCGEAFPRQITSSGPHVWLKFRSDDTIEYEGFRINIKFIDTSTSISIPDKCYNELSGMHGIIDSDKIDQECLTKSENQALDVLWTIKAPENHKIYLNFTQYSLAKPNDCEDNLVQVFGYVLEFQAKLAHYCGSVANAVTTKSAEGNKGGKDDKGNIMYVRLYASKAGRGSIFNATFTAYRNLDPNKEEKCDEETEFNCEDNTCIAKELKCDRYAHCRLKADEEPDLCKGETESMISQPHIMVILVIFSLILAGMSFVFLFKCIRKLYRDHKIIKDHIRQSCEDRLDILVSSRLTLDAKRLQRDSEPRASLERENHTNEMFKQQRKFSQQKIRPTSIDSDFIQETRLDEDEPWRRDVESVPVEPDEVRVERNGKTRRDMSKKEESIRSKRESEEKKEIRDVSVGAPDTKESGCQTRESLFQTETALSSDGSNTTNSRGFSTFGYSGATIARPSPPAQTNTSQITIELLTQVPPQPETKPQKKIPDRRPMSTETTRSAPDVIIVSKPIR